jgi:hypothetical protein
MSLTTAQLQTLKAHILSDQALVALVNTGQYGEIRDALNLQASPDFYVYRTAVTRIEIQNEVGTGGAGGTASEWDWTVYKGQSVSEQGAWRDMAMGDGINFAKIKVREGIAKIFAGTGAIAAMRAHILSFASRLATRAEKILATGTGSIASPATMSFEGQLTERDVEDALVKG